MDDEQLHAIAAESEEMRQECEALRKKLNVLQSGTRVLREHIGKSTLVVSIRKLQLIALV